MQKPVLIVNGRYDYTLLVDKARNRTFQMIGTSAAVKSHVILETPHRVTEQRSLLLKAAFDWLYRHLGRVGPQARNKPA
jgi:eukaryotic-like serine/threonine-protein kinase